MSADESRLAESLAQLGDIAAEAGLDPAAAREEGLRVAAALAESVPGAATEWARVAHPGVTDLARVNEAFFDAASRGRRWRGAPTELLETLVASGNGLAGDYAEALTEVASSAVMLGTAPIWVIANASAASGAYLDAARGGFAAGHRPGVGIAGSPPDGIRALPGASFATPDVFRPNLPGLLGPGTDRTLDPEASSIAPQANGPQAGDAGAMAQAGSAPPPEPGEAPEPQKSVEELLAELDAMIGLGRVKKEIHRQVALLTVERMRVHAGLKALRMSRHLIFVGNPGTGKTTVARLIGAIYRALELLPKGQLVEVDRSELVAGYVGQTAMKTAEVCARATGGVLFIDEAYALTGDQYAQEAVNTLVKEMEDHREDLVVIVAGYPDPMVGFIAQNPGLASRFTTTIEFDDYSDQELLDILDFIAEGADYELTDDARTRVRHQLEATPRTPAFGNGRFSRNLFEQAIGRHAWRLKDATEPTRDDLRLLTADDFTEQPDAPVETDVLQPPDPAPEKVDPVPLRADPDGSGPVDEAVSDEQTAPSEDTR